MLKKKPDPKEHTHMLLFICITCSVKEVMNGGSPGAEGLIAKGHEGA